MTTLRFWKLTTERSAKTFAQAFLAYVGAGTFDVLHFSWVQSLSVSVGAALLSVLTSVISAPIGPDNSPSLVSGE